MKICLISSLSNVLISCALVAIRLSSHSHLTLRSLTSAHTPLYKYSCIGSQVARDSILLMFSCISEYTPFHAILQLTHDLHASLSHTLPPVPLVLSIILLISKQLVYLDALLDVNSYLHLSTTPLYSPLPSTVFGTYLLLVSFLLRAVT